jgi:pimeloyl-ACP methyl ester carboxylesterase
MSDWFEAISLDRRGSGSPLVLLHGIGHRWQAWEPVLDELARHHEVIAVDLPGFGNSPNSPRPYTMPNAVETMAEVFSFLGLTRPHVAGNSLGGALGLELASVGLARSMTALSPAGFCSPREMTWALWVLRQLRQGGRTPVKLRTAAMNVTVVRALLGAPLFGRPWRVPAQAMLDDLVSMVRSSAFDEVAAAGRDYVYASPEPRVPVTIAWGTRDVILRPSQARKAAKALPNATMVRLPRCGHVPMYDDPALVARTILSTCAKASSEESAAA